MAIISKPILQTQKGHITQWLASGMEVMVNLQMLAYLRHIIIVLQQKIRIRIRPLILVPTYGLTMRLVRVGKLLEIMLHLM